MIRRWIDGLDDLAGLDMLMARKDWHGEAGEVVPPVQDHPAWPTLLWQRLRAIWHDKPRERDLAVKDGSCSGGSRRP